VRYLNIALPSGSIDVEAIIQFDLSNDSMTNSVPLKWHWNLWFTLLVLAVLPVTISAGFWQLGRADEKQASLAQLNASLAKAPVALKELDVAAENFRRVKLEGEWAEPLFLLDNRTRSGRVGYEVIGLFEETSGQQVLVNRGWIAAGNDRSKLPLIERPVGNQPVTGYLYMSLQPVVFEQQSWVQEWPERIQAIDLPLIEQRLATTLYPYVVRIDAESPIAYLADWRVEAKGPAMHMGYAVQWFAMSLTVMILFLFANSNLWAWLKAKRA